MKLLDLAVLVSVEYLLYRTFKSKPLAPPDCYIPELWDEFEDYTTRALTGMLH